MTLILTNPRGHVRSATIYDDGERVWVSSTSVFGASYHGISKSVKSAKSLFSRCMLSPKYHGKNVWVQIKDKQ